MKFKVTIFGKKLIKREWIYEFESYGYLIFGFETSRKYEVEVFFD